MISDRISAAAPAAEPVALALALEQSQEVKAKVEACAEDLGSDNDVVKKKIAEGVTTLSAHKILANNERVESKVQECADELHEVNETLSQGIEELKHAEVALAESQDALAESQDALTESQDALTESQDALACTKATLAIAQEETKQAQTRALHDQATGLPNRELFDARLAHAISLAKRHGWTLAVMFLDLDRFKSVNDTHGHAVGDSVLKEVAQRLSEHAREEDTVCRNGGDEFLYMLVRPQGNENIGRIAAAVLDNIAQPIGIGALRLVIKPSIGIAVYPAHGNSAERLIRNADAAMYFAKERTRGYAFVGVCETGSAVN